LIGRISSIGLVVVASAHLSAAIFASAVLTVQVLLSFYWDNERALGSAEIGNLEELILSLADDEIADRLVRINLDLERFRHRRILHRNEPFCWLLALIMSLAFIAVLETSNKSHNSGLSVQRNDPRSTPSH